MAYEEEKQTNKQQTETRMPDIIIVPWSDSM